MMIVNGKYLQVLVLLYGSLMMWCDLLWRIRNKQTIKTPLSVNYIYQLNILSKTKIFPFGGGQDYQFELRASEKYTPIAHYTLNS